MLAVLAANPRTVVVLLNGGPVASLAVADGVPAILEAFYPGQLGGDAIVDTLLGSNNPAGKLPYTGYHANVTVRDIRDVDLRSAGGITHQFFNGSVLFPYGAGLSYTTWAFAWARDRVATGAGVAIGTTAAGRVALSVSVQQLVSAPLVLAATAANTGRVGGDCVLLAFLIGGHGAPANAPLRRLVGFTRERGVEPGGRRTATFEIGARDLATTDASGRLVLAPGRFLVEVGDVVRPASAVLTLVGSPIVLADNGWLQAL